MSVPQRNQKLTFKRQYYDPFRIIIDQECKSKELKDAQQKILKEIENYVTKCKKDWKSLSFIQQIKKTDDYHTKIKKQLDDFYVDKKEIAKLQITRRISREQFIKQQAKTRQRAEKEIIDNQFAIQQLTIHLSHIDKQIVKQKTIAKQEKLVEQRIEKDLQIVEDQQISSKQITDKYSRTPATVRSRPVNEKQDKQSSSKRQRT